MMRILATIAVVGGGWLAAAAPAATPGHDVVLEGKELAAELAKPQYLATRCMLPPVLGSNGRAVVTSSDPALRAGDAIVVADGHTLDAEGRVKLIQVLEHIQPGVKVTLRVLRAGAEQDVSVQCSDSRPYYGALRAAAQAAAADNARDCADRLDKAAQLHGLSSIWLRLSLSCRVQAGILTGDQIWAADYALYSQRIAEAQSSPAILNRLRHGVATAATEMIAHGNTALGEKLRRQYAAALAAAPPPARAPGAPDD